MGATPFLGWAGGRATAGRVAPGPVARRRAAGTRLIKGSTGTINNPRSHARNVCPLDLLILIVKTSQCFYGWFRIGGICFTLKSQPFVMGFLLAILNILKPSG